MNKKLKIAIIGSRGYPYVYSGYETLVKELSERLVKKGHTVRVYCHKFLFKNRPKKINGIELIYTPSIQSKIFSQLFNSFFSFLHVCFSNVDVILVVNSANGPFGILTKIFRKKTCINVDGLEWLRPKWKGIGSLYFKFASKLSTMFFDEIITDSIEMNKVYRNKFGKKSTVIAYGSTILVTKKSKALEKLKLKKKEYYLIVGRLIPDNNADLIVDGFLNSNTKKKLIIVGDVHYKDHYANNIKKNTDERIIFTGYVKDQNILAELYYNCYVYIHGHEYGGTNPTMINAMAHGCAIIALDTVFNKEMLQNKFGLFFKKKSSSVTSLVNFCEKESNKMEEFRINSVKGITNKYDWDNITNQYFKVFKNLIS